MGKADLEYLILVQDIMKKGVKKSTRSGNVRSVFGRQIRFDLKNDGLPILTTKKMFHKGCLCELLWFLKGNTNIRELLLNNVHIWDDDAYRFYCEKVKKHNEVCEFFEQKYEETKNSCYRLPSFSKPMETETKEDFIKNVLNEKKVFFNEVPYYLDVSKTNYTYGDLGPVYGKQWRAFGIPQVDQIKDIIDKLKNNPDDRRMLCVAYNPCDVDKMALPPCHVMFQFYTSEMTPMERLDYAWKHGKILDKEFGNAKQLDEMNIPKRKLSLMWTQRSVDVMLGLPFNILSYALLTYLVASVCNMEVDELIGSLGDCHIYENHMEGVNIQLERDPLKYDNKVSVEINPEIKQIDGFTINDIHIVNYESDDKIFFPLSVG